jgi:ribosome-binding protein aMBF1 (putative translation factor)
MPNALKAGPSMILIGIVFCTTLLVNMTSLKDKRLLREMGARIRSLREAKGWTQQQFADQCGMHRTYIAGTERGERNLTVLSLKRLADILRVSLSELLG